MGSNEIDLEDFQILIVLPEKRVESKDLEPELSCAMLAAADVREGSAINAVNKPAALQTAAMCLLTSIFLRCSRKEE